MINRNLKFGYYFYKNRYLISLAVYRKKDFFFDGLILSRYLEIPLAVSSKILKVFLFDQRLEPILLKDKLLMIRAANQNVISFSK